ncbi:uncharacterized protein BX663DRAFT_545010 [Cokeromyces recurvatus]|uniref:uncharacterized protein n=1 Tax=Cokeromyces recurvatus TaxID=90255 RepID=UPI0022208D0A|nr:uncharacterized protein BX663DRAFT_545010 [Cokeromyces recurvatus]KAI7900285.1 hypothetical protein BX663DRAFT_545010 [Cokeromyces recurvatus]
MSTTTSLNERPLKRRRIEESSITTTVSTSRLSMIHQHLQFLTTPDAPIIFSRGYQTSITGKSKIVAQRVINYSLEAFNWYKINPIALIICTNTLSDCVAKDVDTSEFPACCEYPSTVQALEAQDQEHTKILELLDKNASSKEVAKAIKTLQSQNHAIERKFNDINVSPSSISTKTTADTTNTENSNVPSELVISSYERGMIFVENFKKARMLNGLKHRRHEGLE